MQVYGGACRCAGVPYRCVCGVQAGVCMCKQMCRGSYRCVGVHADVKGTRRYATVHTDCEGVHTGVGGTYRCVWGACRYVGCMQVCGECMQVCRVHAGVWNACRCVCGACMCVGSACMCVGSACRCVGYIYMCTHAYEGQKTPLDVIFQVRPFF